MKRAAVVSAVAVLVLTAGCGGREAVPADQVSAAVKDLTDSARSREWGDYCAATTNPRECLNVIATFEANGVDLAGLVPSEELMERAKITVNGARATVDATAAEDAVYVRRDGRWLFQWPASGTDPK